MANNRIFRGCNNCYYADYDQTTGFYNCMREDELTEKDTDDLTETGGVNCSCFELDHEETIIKNNDQLSNIDIVKEILSDIEKA